ncbi:Glutamate receptor ionotropic, kainate 4 [Saguinus oedipus]|uniref:Glutamate receptor ionotropic, kainate 4 n=1 Tax=Saguinus oedipus TaxID=9490 RepID=A0ABQ9US33_SAGOE|nr:Glutamate receptor ionotropic, kainate 4 [Saguinus oedipus]
MVYKPRFYEEEATQPGIRRLEPTPMINMLALKCEKLGKEDYGVAALHVTTIISPFTEDVHLATLHRGWPTKVIHHVAQIHMLTLRFSPPLNLWDAQNENPVSVCQEMVTELRSIILCQDSIHPRRRRAGVPPPRPPIPEERRPRGTATLSNGKLCGAGEPDQLAQRLAQEAALVARGCTHIRVCPECRRFQGLRARPSPARSEESLDWEKTTNSSEPE